MSSIVTPQNYFDGVQCSQIVIKGYQNDLLIVCDASNNRQKCVLTLDGVFNGTLADGIVTTSTLDDGVNDVINNALTTANGKNTNYYGTATPTNPINGDNWFKTTADGIETLQYIDGTWVSVTDMVANAAKTAAAGAQATANGKNTVYYAATAPTGGTYTNGDLWFDTSNDNCMSTWNGSSWASKQLGSLAISNIDAGKITTGFLSANRIAANSIAASCIYGITITANQIISGMIESARIDTASLKASVLYSGDDSSVYLSIGATEYGNGLVLFGNSGIQYWNVYGSTATTQMNIPNSHFAINAAQDFRVNSYGGASQITLSSNFAEISGGGVSVQCLQGEVLMDSNVAINGTLSVGGYTNLSTSGVNTVLKNAAGSSIYLEASGGVNVVNSVNSAYAPILASAFIVTSEEKWKQDITLCAENALNIVNSADIYQYKLKDEVSRGIDNVNYGFVIGADYHTPSQVLSSGGNAISQYSMSAILWKATQELTARVTALETKLAV